MMNLLRSFGLAGAWLVALVATLGALFIGEIMGQTPCTLCWYQRILMFPLAVVLAVAVWRNDAGVRGYVLPLATGGVLVAGYHTLLYFGVVAERLAPCRAGVPCTGGDMTILGGLPLPLLALVAFLAIAFLLIIARPGARG